MKHLVLKTTSYYIRQAIDHIYSLWYRLFIGHVGKRTLIRRHCRLDGDRLDRVSIGANCGIDTNFCLGARSISMKDGKKLVPEIIIGDNCIFGQYNHITAVNRIVIGNNLLTGKFVLITDNSHGGFNADEMDIHPSRRPVVSKGEVFIGNNVWLGDKVSVLPGVHIGDGCIVGSNAVVTHDIPAYSIAVGNPARVVKSLINE